MEASRLSRAFYLQIARNPSDRLNEEKKIRFPGCCREQTNKHTINAISLL